MPNPELGKFFRKNISDFPVLATKFYDLIKSSPKDPGVIAQEIIAVGGRLRPDRFPPEMRSYIQNSREEAGNLIDGRQGRYLDAIILANRRLTAFEGQFTGEYVAEGSAVLLRTCAQIQELALQYPKQSGLEDLETRLGYLSTAADYMRADTRLGVLTAEGSIAVAHMGAGGMPALYDLFAREAMGGVPSAALELKIPRYPEIRTLEMATIRMLTDRNNQI